jgi:hypothetical protein
MLNDTTLTLEPSLFLFDFYLLWLIDKRFFNIFILFIMLSIL